jgi:hypothetical protein
MKPLSNWNSLENKQNPSNWGSYQQKMNTPKWNFSQTTKWPEKREQMLDVYSKLNSEIKKELFKMITISKRIEDPGEKNKKISQKPSSDLSQREVQTAKIKSTMTREEIIETRINEAIEKFKNEAERQHYVNEPIGGQTQSRSQRKKNNQKLSAKLRILQQKNSLIRQNPKPKKNITNYNLAITNSKFWLQKRNGNVKLAVLKENFNLEKRHFLLYNLGIPKSIKHTKFYSLQINTPSQEIIPNRRVTIPFCINKFINTKYNRIFNTNESTAVALKIQEWSVKCTSQYNNAKILKITLFDYRNYEEEYNDEYDYQDWNLCYLIRFSIKVKFTFEIMKSLKYCGSTKARITEELSQKWIYYKKQYFKGVRSIRKGIISWNSIEKDIYDRKAETEEIEVIEDDEPFEMNLQKFYNMINISKNQKIKRMSNPYRINDFITNKDYITKWKISYSTIQYFKEKNFEFSIEDGWGIIYFLDEKGYIQQIRNTLAIVETCEIYERSYAYFYGI